MNNVRIGNKWVGPEFPCFLVGEIGINHNGSLEIAKKLIDEAAAAGWDAVKFQKRTVDVVYTPEELARSRENPFGPTNGDLKRGLEFGYEQYDEIDGYCQEKNMLWFASPWDEQSVDFLEEYDPPCYKIASACNLDRGLLIHIKSTGRPMIVSTGMTDDYAIDRIVDILGEEGLIILHCTSTYPAKYSELNLANIPRLIKKYPKAIVGYSGHEVGAYPSLVAAALGACMIERHITLDRAMWGSDQSASLEVGGMSRLASDIKALPTWLGQSTKSVLDSEKPIEVKLRRKNTVIF